MPRAQQARCLNGRLFEQTRLQLGRTKWLGECKGAGTTEWDLRG